MRKNLNPRLLVPGLVVALALAGCSKKKEGPPPSMQELAAKAKPAAQAPVPAPTQAQLSSVRPLGTDLDFKRRTDPFKPYAPVVAPPQQAQTKGEQAPQRPAADLLPIQGFETGKFRVSGIIAGLRENRALVLDPNGKGYVVQAGMPIGNNNGQVSRITASTVEVVESYKDEKGKTRRRTIVLTLAKKR